MFIIILDKVYLIINKIKIYIKYNKKHVSIYKIIWNWFKDKFCCAYLNANKEEKEK